MALKKKIIIIVVISIVWVFLFAGECSNSRFMFAYKILSSLSDFVDVSF